MNARRELRGDDGTLHWAEHIFLTIYIVELATRFAASHVKTFSFPYFEQQLPSGLVPPHCFDKDAHPKLEVGSSLFAGHAVLGLGTVCAAKT